jgi:hypothetical protein
MTTDSIRGSSYNASLVEAYLRSQLLHVAGVGGFATGNYWSSSENNATNAWHQKFSNGYQNDFGGKNSTSYVRPVRAFS